MNKHDRKMAEEFRALPKERQIELVEEAVARAEADGKIRWTGKYRNGKKVYQSLLFEMKQPPKGSA